MLSDVPSESLQVTLIVYTRDVLSLAHRSAATWTDVDTVAVWALAGPNTGVVSKTQSSPAAVSPPHPELPAASAASWSELMPVTWIPSVSAPVSAMLSGCGSAKLMSIVVIL